MGRMGRSGTRGIPFVVTAFSRFGQPEKRQSAHYEPWRSRGSAVVRRSVRSNGFSRLLGSRTSAKALPTSGWARRGAASVNETRQSAEEEGS